jgi:hypothetical protein
MSIMGRIGSKQQIISSLNVCPMAKVQPVRLAYQPPASSIFLSEQTSHQQPASSIFLSEKISTSYQPPAKQTGWWCGGCIAWLFGGR